MTGTNAMQPVQAQPNKTSYINKNINSNDPTIQTSRDTSFMMLHLVTFKKI